MALHDGARRCASSAFAAALALALCGCGADASGNDANGSASDGSALLMGAECAAPFLASENGDTRQDARYALELASAALPAALLDVFIALIDLEYDVFDLNVEARRAELAPYQDPIVERGRQSGGDVVVQFWTDNSLAAKLPAGRVHEVFCWPNVTAVEVSTPFWSVVAPPWDESSVGSAECPLLEAGGCPEHCAEVWAARYDATRECARAEHVGCDRDPFREATPDEKCRVRTATGDLYVFGGVGPREPEFLGWRECSDEEYARVSGMGTRCASR